MSEFDLLRIPAALDHPLGINFAFTIGWNCKDSAPQRAGTLLLICCAAFLLNALSDQFHRRAKSETSIEAALQNMSQGLVMFDAATSLVVCNRHYIEMYGLSSAVVQPECSLRDLLEHRAATGSFDAKEIDKHAAEIEGAIRHNAPARKLTGLHDGRVIQIVNQSTGRADGSLPMKT